MEHRPVLTEAEKWELKRKRSEPTQPMEDLYEEVDEDDEDVQMAGKGPAYRQVELEEDDVDDEGEELVPNDEPEEAHDNLPNLHEYFQHFDVTDEKVISMCRAYASYLSSLRPKKSTNAYATPRRRSAATADQAPPSQKQRYWEAKRKRK